MKTDLLALLQSPHGMQMVHMLIVFLFLIVCVIWLDHLIKRDDNDLTWDDLVSVHGSDGKNHADWTKIGQGAGVFIAVSCPLLYFLSDRFEPIGGAALLGASLLYLGGVAGYSAALRAKRNGNDHA